MANSQQHRLPLSAWEARILRLTVFPSPAEDLSSLANWWETLTGELPEGVQFHPKTSAYKAIGPFARGNLELNVEVPKIDWVYAADDSAGRSLGPVEEEISMFHDLTGRWFELPEAPAAVRIAFGAVLWSRVGSREEGYRQLSSYLPFDLDTETSSDFLYQINRRRTLDSPIAGLGINRLSKWAVLAFGQVLVSPGATRQIGPDQFACALELDINTVPEFEGEMNRSEQRAIFGTLIQLGTEIVREGDVP